MFNHTYRLNPDDAEAYNNRAVVYYEREDSKTIADCEKVIRLTKDSELIEKAKHLIEELTE